MEILTIKIPNGYEIDSLDKLSGEIKFREKPKKAIDRIKTISDILADNGFTQQRFDQQCAGLERDEIGYRLLKLLAKSLNEGWVPDWNASDQYKYYPWFYMGGSSGFRFSDYAAWDTDSNVGSRLCFKTRELAEYAAQQFTSVYKQFMTIE